MKWHQQGSSFSLPIVVDGVEVIRCEIVARLLSPGHYAVIVGNYDEHRTDYVYADIIGIDAARAHAMVEARRLLTEALAQLDEVTYD